MQSRSVTCVVLFFGQRIQDDKFGVEKETVFEL